MFKLALDAGHSLYTAGKRCLKALDPNETREWWLNNRICNKIQDKLSAYEEIEILRVDDITGNTDVSRAERCRRANEWGADFYLSVHHNAGIYGGNGGGFEVYRYIKLSAAGDTAKKQQILYEELVKAGVPKGNRSSNIKTADFEVLRDTNMEAALIESAFMDSAVDVPVLLTDEFAERVATGCVNSAVRFGNLQKKVIKEPEGVEPPKVEETIEEPKPEEPIPEEVPEVTETIPDNKNTVLDNDDTVSDIQQGDTESVEFTGSYIKKWLKAAGVRAIKTIAQTMIASIGTSAIISTVDWKIVISSSLLAGILSILTSIKGLPEIK